MSINIVYRGHALRIAVGIIMLLMLLLAENAGAATQINSCTTISSSGDYVLTKNIINSSAIYCINITSSNVIFDGAGNTIDGRDTYESYGVNVYNPAVALANVTVKNLKASDWHFGINYRNTRNGKINNITANSNLFGIRLSYSRDSILTGNTASSNEDDGILLDYSNNSILTTNKVSLNTFGIDFYPFSNNNTLVDNIVSSNTYTGIWFDTDFLSFYSSNNNTLINNTASSNQDGIILNHLRNSTLINNTASLNSNIGISLSQAHNNILNSSTANSNRVGIQLGFSNNNTLRENTASSNTNYGIYISYYSSNNTIYNNYFNNNNNSYLITPWFSNLWNISKTAGANIAGGPYLGGNFWANPNGTGVSQTCADGNKDGICDSPYALGGNNIDYLPLTYKPAAR